MSANTVLNHIKRRYKLKTDRALADALDISPPNISKLRKGSTPFGPEWIMRVHDATGLSIRDIKSMLKERIIS